jgi:hypothetical protein
VTEKQIIIQVLKYLTPAIGFVILCIIVLFERRKPEHHFDIPIVPDEKRMAKGIPLEEEIIMATVEDMENAQSVDESIARAVSPCFPQKAKWKISASREIGNHVLLWIDIPGKRDDGIDLVYSKTDEKIVCGFSGRYRA